MARLPCSFESRPGTAGAQAGARGALRPAISGYLDTSHGRVLTTVAQSVNFLSTQTFNVSPSTDIQDVQQSTRVESRVVTRGGGEESTSEQHFSYPLSLNYSLIFNSDGSSTQVTTSEQRDLERESFGDSDGRDRSLHNHVHSTDTLQFDASFKCHGTLRRSNHPDVSRRRL